MEQHKNTEDKLSEEEERTYIYKHSKPPLKLNPWKFSNHVIGEFSRPPIDQKREIREFVKPRPQYMVDPFRRPKDIGDYFDKHIGIL